MKLRARSLALWQVLTALIGPDEVLLVVALTLVTVALWPLAETWCGSGRVALLVPGGVGLFVSMPSRAPFVARPTVPETKRTR